MEAHEKGIDAGVLAFARDSGWGMPPVKSVEIAIQAYLEASNQVLVPREPTEEMASQGESAASFGIGKCYDDEAIRLVWRWMTDAYPDPFKDK